MKCLVKASESTRHNSQSPTGEDKEIENTTGNHDPHLNIPPKKSNHTLSSSEDDNDQAPVHQKNVRARTKKRILLSELEDHSDQARSPVQPRKKVRVGSKKKHHRSETVEEDHEVDNNSKNIHQKKNNKKPTGDSKKSSNSRKNDASNDSDIEIMEKPQETPEKELGMWIQ